MKSTRMNIDKLYYDELKSKADAFDRTVNECNNLRTAYHELNARSEAVQRRLADDITKLSDQIGVVARDRDAALNETNAVKASSSLVEMLVYMLSDTMIEKHELRRQLEDETA